MRCVCFRARACVQACVRETYGTPIAGVGSGRGRSEAPRNVPFHASFWLPALPRPRAPPAANRQQSPGRRSRGRRMQCQGSSRHRARALACSNLGCISHIASRKHTPCRSAPNTIASVACASSGRGRELACECCRSCRACTCHRQNRMARTAGHGDAAGCQTRPRMHAAYRLPASTRSKPFRQFRQDETDVGIDADSSARWASKDVRRCRGRRERGEGRAQSGAPLSSNCGTAPNPSAWCMARVPMSSRPFRSPVVTNALPTKRLFALCAHRVEYL